MKRILLLMTSMLLMCALDSCAGGDGQANNVVNFFTGGETINASENYVTKNIPVKPFDKIVVTGSLDVEFTQDAGKHQVDIYTSDNVVDLIDVYSKSSTLYFSFKKNVKVSYKKLKIYVKGKTLQAVTLKGSGDFTFKNDFKGDALDITLIGSGDIDGNSITCSQDINVSLSGSGDINFNSLKANAAELMLAGSGDIGIKNINATYVNANVAGSGDIELHGKTKKADYTVAGSGDLNASGLAADEVSASVGGSGDIQCHAIHSLDASTAGSGDISYKGNPTKVKKGKNVHRL